MPRSAQSLSLTLPSSLSPISLSLLKHRAAVASPKGRLGYELIPPKCGPRTGLPLVPCPKCSEEILELVAAPGSKVPGTIFFKCRLHERDVPGTCPWFLFADKYERMLIDTGVIRLTRVETEQPVLALSDEVGGLHGVGTFHGTDNGDDVEALKASIGGLDGKLKKLVVLGEIGVACIVVLAVFVVLGVIKMLVK